jgi:hypothetical protein
MLIRKETQDILKSHWKMHLKTNYQQQQKQQQKMRNLIIIYVSDDSKKDVQ